MIKTFRTTLVTACALLLLALVGCGGGGDGGENAFIFPGGSGGVPAQLAFTTQPARAAGQAFNPNIMVEIRDINNIIVPDATNPVTLTLANAPGATLMGTTTVNAVNGVATFPGLSVDIVGTGYTLNASSPGLTGASSSAFNVTPDAANAALVTVQPQNIDAGGMIPPVTVDLRDAFGNIDTNSNAAVTVALVPVNGGTGTLGGTTMVNAVNGVAIFNDLTVDTQGQYMLVFSSPGLTDGPSSNFSVFAPVLFGTFPGIEPTAPAYLARINPTDGTFQTVGSTTSNFFPLATDSNGRLISAANDAMTTDAVLGTLDQATGTPTIIGTLSNLDNVGGCEAVRDLTFDAVTNMLYGVIDNCNGAANPGLFSIDLTTGAGTKLSDGTFAAGTTGQGVASNSAGTFFHTPADNLVNINPMTGAMTNVFTGTMGRTDVSGLAFQPGTDTLFGASRDTNELITIDPATGTLSSMFASAPSLTGLTFVRSDVPFTDRGYDVTPIALDYTDISATGTPFNLGDDAGTPPVDFGFPFNFFGVDFTNCAISSNGFLTMAGQGALGDFSNESLPTRLNNHPNMVCLYWDDLDPGDDGASLFAQTVGTAPNRVFIVQYVEFDFFPGDGTAGGTAIIQAQMKLFETTNVIEFHYQTLAGANGNSATIGVQDGSGTRAAQFSFNTANTIMSGTALRFTPRP
ncbi:MAG: hypothetical protein AB7S38_40120 [Vulcanimicrobiota bacterium]